MTNLREAFDLGERELGEWELGCQVSSHSPCFAYDAHSIRAWMTLS